MARPRRTRPKPDQPEQPTPTPTISTSRKRSRSASTSTSANPPQDASRLAEAIAADEGTVRRSKRAKRNMGTLNDAQNLDADKETAGTQSGAAEQPAQEGTAEDDSQASAASSATLIAPDDRNDEHDGDRDDDMQDVTEHHAGEEKQQQESKLDAMSPEERRKAKGKGKATAEELEAEGEEKKKKVKNLGKGGGGQNEELDRIKKELASKNELISEQLAILASLHTAATCTVCLEVLDRPHALACGHVFCRKCLQSWFFRPDPDADSSSDSDSDSSTGSSYVGGHLNGQEFRVRDASDAQVRGMFETAEAGMFEFLERSRAARSGGRVGGPAGAVVGSIAPAEVEEEEEEEEETTAGRETEEQQLSPDALRRARLARFGQVATGSSDARSPHFPPTTTTSSEVPLAFASASASAAAPRRRCPSSPPLQTPVQAPLRLPVGLHRRQNLVCPQCRTPCSERAPGRVFQLDELVGVVRRHGVGEDGSLHRPTSPGPAATAQSSTLTSTANTEEPKQSDESDPTWSGLWPAVGGRESGAERRSRLARVVRDREDGVRRCGECGWEIDERNGACEGCGREWEPSESSSNSDSESSASSSSIADVGPIPLGLLNAGRSDSRRQRHRLGRRHDDVDLSGNSTEEEDRELGLIHDDDGTGRGGDGTSGDEYDMEDGFIVASAEEDDGEEEDEEEGDGGNEEGEEELEAAEARLRAMRKRRAQRQARSRRRIAEAESDLSSESSDPSDSSDASPSSAEEEVGHKKKKGKKEQGGRKRRVIFLDSDDSDDVEERKVEERSDNGSSTSSNGSAPSASNPSPLRPSKYFSSTATASTSASTSNARGRPTGSTGRGADPSRARRSAAPSVPSVKGGSMPIPAASSSASDSSDSSSDSSDSDSDSSESDSYDSSDQDAAFRRRAAELTHPSKLKKKKEKKKGKDGEAGHDG